MGRGSKVAGTQVPQCLAEESELSLGGHASPAYQNLCRGL